MPTLSLATAPLGALRAFESAARLGSFKAAAAELFVTPAAISHQIVTLEDYLGARLFVRLNRAVRLTPTGAELAASLSAAFAQIQGALLAAAPHRAESNVLTISAVPSLATRWLAPRLHRFHQQHPGMDLRVASSDTLVDLLNDTGVDIALRYGPGPYVDLHAEVLWPHDPVVPVCSPSLLAQLPAEPAAVQATDRVSLLRVALPRSPAGQAPANTDNVWPQWLVATGCATPVLLAAARTGPLYSVTHLAIDAAVAGHGIALAPLALVADDLAAGRLVRWGIHSTPDGNAHCLLCRADKLHLPTVRAFRDWLRAEVSLH